MAHTIRIRGRMADPRYSDVRQYLVDDDDEVVGRVFIRRSGEVHLVWDSGDRFVCCWGTSGTGDVFKLWTYRVYENRHEFYEGELAVRVAQHYWSCVEYTEGEKTIEMPPYVSHTWWLRWRDDSDSDSSPHLRQRELRQLARPHPYRRTPRTADMGRTSSGSSGSSGSLSDDCLPYAPAYNKPAHRPKMHLDPHVNERIRRLESALMWHSNMLERIMNCKHHDCTHADEAVRTREDRAKAASAALANGTPDQEGLGSTLNRLENLSGDIDHRLKQVQLCEGCA